MAAPGYTEDLRVDEAELEQVLQDEVNYMREGTLRHDLDALIAIHRLRGGRLQPILEVSRAVFLTTNSKLVRAGERFFQQDDCWPPAILDSDLATVVWLKKPMRAPDLPYKQIMAYCYAALHPAPPMMRRWLDEIERIEAAGTYSDEQLNIMRYSPDARRALMDVTLGDPAAIGAETVPRVLAAAEARITDAVRQQYEQQVDAERDRRQQAETRAEQADLAAEAATAAIRQDGERRRGAMRRRAERSGRRLAAAVHGAAALLVVTAVVLSLLGHLLPGPHVSIWVRGALWALVVILGGLTVAGAVWGGSLKDLRVSLERQLTEWRYRAALRRAGEEVASGKHG